MTENLLTNWSFESGWYDGPSGQIPNGWLFWYIEQDNLVKPETRVLPKAQVPPEEWDLFFLDGDYCVKVFKGFGAWQGGYIQTITVTPGETYRLTINVYADIVDRYENGRKIPPNDPYSAMVRLYADGVVVGDWRTMTFLAQNQIVWEFTAQSNAVQIFVEFWCKYAIQNNGFFLDAWLLEHVTEPQPGSDFNRVTLHQLDYAPGMSTVLAQKVPAIILYQEFGRIGDTIIPQPETLVIGSKPVGYDSRQLYQNYPDPVAAATKAVDDIAAQFASDPHIDYWMLSPFNEPNTQADSAFWEWLTLTTIAAMQRAREVYNKSLLVGLFSTGTPANVDVVNGRPSGVGWQNMKTFSLALGYAARNDHLFGLHEYFTDSPQENYDFPNAPYPGGVGFGWNMVRYPLWSFLLESDLLDPSFVPLAAMPLTIIDEFGAEWRRHGWTEQEYWDKITWYAERIKQDAHIRAACLFTCSGSDLWSTYNVGLSGIPDRIAAAAQQQPAPLPQWPEPGEPQPPEPPPGCPGLPREDYVRVVNVVPPSATQEQFSAIALECWNRSHETVTGSYDDGGIGDLSDKTVRLYGIPEIEKQSYLDFYAEHYPGTSVIFADMPGGGQPPEPPPVADIKIGLHDEGGGEWLKANGVQAMCLAHGTVQAQPRQIDMRHLSDAGIRVLYRLGYGYADGSGCIPRPDQLDAWVSAMVQTINGAQGVYGFIIGNEVNNPAEWPGYPANPFIVSPEYYVSAFNRIAAQTSARLSPSPVDPYNVVAAQFGQPGDPKDWFYYFLDHCYEIAFISLHAKTQGCDPALCWSHETFIDPPLIGRYQHLRTIEQQLSWFGEFGDIETYVTELNMQRRCDGQFGVEPGSGEWVRQAKAYIDSVAGARISGAALYRYDHADPWGVAGDAGILGALL